MEARGQGADGGGDEETGVSGRGAVGTRPGIRFRRAGPVSGVRGSGQAERRENACPLREAAGGDVRLLRAVIG